MKKIAIVPVLFASLFACTGGSGPEADGTRYSYAKQSKNGFEAIVDSEFTLTDMQNTFGNYCKRNGKVTRSLRMVPDEGGKKRVIGACL